MRLVAAIAAIAFLNVQPAHAQNLKPAFAVTVGSTGVGLEGDIAHRRAAVFVRAGATLSTSTRAAGLRVFFSGQRSSGFYLAPVIVRLSCNIGYGARRPQCAGQQYTFGLVALGLEAGEARSNMSVMAEAGPYLGSRDVPGFLDFSFIVGLKWRAR